jgi:hypothetical protein
MDFTLKTYIKLLTTLRNQGFSFVSFDQFVSETLEKTIVLRHDVDALPENSLEFSRIQSILGMKGSYYFRIVPESFNEKIIKEIYELGHEVGYHYEDLSFAWAKLKAVGGRQKADGEELEKQVVDIGIESFTKNLENLRKIVPVRTICMHGSPMSRWDSRLLWKYYDYRDFGIIGEPYFDIDFSEVLYLSDTGRRWDGEAVSVRDKAVGSRLMAEGYKDLEKTVPVNYSLPPSAFRLPPFPRFHSTFDIIKAAEEGALPDKIMMTFHPQRWTDKPVPWVKELVWQNVKNVGKYFLMKIRGF